MGHKISSYTMEANRDRTGSEGTQQNVSRNTGKTPYMWEEVKKHTSADDLWFVIDNEVYDVTRFKKHPGQFQILMKYGGKDATQAFIDIAHSEKAKKLMKSFKIGLIHDTDYKHAEDSKPIPWLLYFDRLWMSCLMFTMYYIVYQASTSPNI